MTRRYGIDVSHFQAPAAPAGLTYETMSGKAQFVIARATYGAWRDPQFTEHIRRARIEAMQVGAYHFFCIKQLVSAQLDVFTDQCSKALIGAGDILPALDIEDDGANKITPAWSQPVRNALDIMVSEFGGAIVYITQAGWAQMGKPTWLLDYPLWVAHYNGRDPAASKPATPGNKTPAIWQYRVGPFKPGAAFVLGQEKLPNAIDHNLADAPLPFCKTSPSAGGVLPAPGPAPRSAAQIWNDRLLDQLTINLRDGMHDERHDDDAPDTERNA